MKTTVIALLDKEYPPHHSFVDGMLASVLAREPGFRVRLVVSVGTQANVKKVPVHRFGRAACLPLLFQRRGAGRFANLLVVLWVVRPMVQRERARGHRVVLFVRNCPVLLLAARLLRKDVDRVVFQSSFPHEEAAAWWPKRVLARSLYRLSAGGIDSLLAISPLGLKRVRHLFPEVQSGAYIPLVADAPNRSPSVNSNGQVPGGEPVKFVYIGSHSANRQLEVVLRGVVLAVRGGANGRFFFIGANEDEVQRLTGEEEVLELVRCEVIAFQSPILRTELLQRLSNFDVGFSLIPATTHYSESSPTKLAEYMGAGLAILATRGIPLQEKFVTESQAGVLVDWSPEQIAGAITALCASPERVQQMGIAARGYTEQAMNYRFYLETLTCLL